MATRVMRRIVRIDEDRCDGCGLCVPACVEGAIEIIGGKARLVSESYCDGLGACLGECPQGAISIEERESEEFDEEAAGRHACSNEHDGDTLPCGCPSATVTRLEIPPAEDGTADVEARLRSELSHWPVQLTLVPPNAPFLQQTDLLLAADCVPFVYAEFHRDFLRDRTLLVACPKLDDYQAHLRKLTEILHKSSIRSLTVVLMEVGCCRGLTSMAEHAMQASSRDIPLSEVVVAIRGDLK